MNTVWGVWFENTVALLPLAAFCAGVVDVGILEHLRLMVLSDQGEVVVLCHWQALAVHLNADGAAAQGSAA